MLDLFSRRVITGGWKLVGTDPDLSDMLIIVANVDARMSVLAFTSEVGS